MTTMNYSFEPANLIEIEELLAVDDIAEITIEVDFYYEGAELATWDDPGYPETVTVENIKIVSYLKDNKIVNVNVDDKVNNTIASLITTSEYEKIEAACFEDVEEHNSNMLLDSLIDELDPPFDDYY